MAPIILLFIALFILVFTWYKEPRIFLFLFHKVVFPTRRGKALNIDKSVHFPESTILENSWKVICQELEAVISNIRPLPKFHEVDKSNHKISFDNGPAWRTLVLKAYDGWFTNNCKLFPETFRLLKGMPAATTIMFSILEPCAKIPSHTGKFSGIWRYHLALVVPSVHGCYLEVNGEKYFWREGEGILFNDTFLHSVTNNSDGYRIVLFLDIKKRASFVVQLTSNFILSLIRLSPVFKRALKAGVIN